MVEKLNFGPWFVVLVLASEAALLFVAAQNGIHRWSACDGK